MKKADCRIPITCLALLGLLAAGAAAADRRDKHASCHQEIRRVAVWPKGGAPKAQSKAHFEERQVTICDGKVVARAKRQPTSG